MSSATTDSVQQGAHAASAPRSRLARIAKKRPSVIVGMAVLILFSLVSLFASLIAPFDPEALQPSIRLQPPGGDHLLGTDRYGRDVFSRILHGGSISLLVAWSVSVAVLVLGGVVGLIAGYSRRLDAVLMRVMDGFMAFPDVLLAIALMAALGANVLNVIIALTAVYIPRMARIVRSSALVIKEQLYVEAASATGLSNFRILIRHVLPGTLPAAMVQATVTFALAVLAEAALSFLGVGTPPSEPSWGNIISEGRLYIRQAPWVLIYPGVVIAVTVLAVNMLGDGLRDLLDPRMRSVIGKEKV